MRREDILRYCNPAAIYGARRVILAEGRGEGQRLVEVKTTAGLRASFMEDKCLDILDLEYKGVNLAFLSKNGLMDVRHSEGDAFHRYWAGGFLSTCGLRNTGTSCTVGKEFFPFHGRIGLTPAENVSVRTDDNNITISGITRETALFGHCLEMERTIVIPINGAKITVRDQVRNLTPEAEYIFFLYHINFGYPFLNEELILEWPESEVNGRTPESIAAIDNRFTITKPKDNEPEHVYFYHTEEEYPQVKLTNPKLNINAKIQYDRKQLPALAQWKCMRSGDYALGIEPGTSIIRGRAQELENGYDIKVPAFGTLEYGFTIELD
ncbi:MAG: aldose 1-epimerase family protein [Defluviitaleaceae bacterium]|nr:aldose 1-epimerase family protein [Defluviitaleaceae bacterium]